ncbi:MAG: hypothetical protein WCI18_12100 [Pseudomonadota bacterium]
MNATSKIGLVGGVLGVGFCVWSLTPSRPMEAMSEYRRFYAEEAQAVFTGAGRPSNRTKNREGLDAFDIIQALESREKEWILLSPLCSGYPSKGKCDDGDSVLFNGLLCHAGLELGCETVRKSLNTRTGEWVRSPRRVDYSPLADEDAKSFSRDHMLGILLYTAKTGDFESYDTWRRWMKESPKCLVQVLGRCLMESQVSHLCRTFDFGCLYLPGINRLSDTVLSLAGGRNKQWRIAEGGNLSTEWILRFELKMTSPGYPLHLKAVSLLLLGSLAYDKDFVSELSQDLVKRDPRNLFFQFLADDSTSGAIRQSQSLLDQCSVSFHNLRKRDSTRNQWSFERDSSEKAWRSSMGWDCVFLNRMLVDRLSSMLFHPDLSEDEGSSETPEAELSH